MFSLTKAGEIWTLHYEVGPLRRALLIGAVIAGLGVGIFQSFQANPAIPAATVFAGAFLCIAVMGYWALSDAATTATFDLKQRVVRVHSERPWFGEPRTCALLDVAALYAVNRSGDTVDSWEAVIEFRDGARIRLGREAEGRNERVRRYLEEIRSATGIAGR